MPRPAAGELRARPGQRGAGSAERGLITLGDAPRPALLHVPRTITAASPLVVMLHGAGGNAHHSVDLVRAYADRFGFILLAPSSAAATWDVIARRAYGIDADTIDELLGQVFGRYTIDPARLAIAGFSDGASYALSLGLMNGDLFSHVIAFSPGFAAPAGVRGAPTIFLSHGVKDTVLPIDACSRTIEKRLSAAGYSLDYREFPDGHVVPDAIAEAFFSNLVEGSRAG